MIQKLTKDDINTGLLCLVLREDHEAWWNLNLAAKLGEDVTPQELWDAGRRELVAKIVLGYMREH